MRPPPQGPWTNPPKAQPKSKLWPAQSPVRWQLPRRREQRKPFINNWRGLLIVGFLLFVAPVLAGWAARWIMAMINGG